MKIVKKILKWFSYFLLIPISYFLISLILTFITVNGSDNSEKNTESVYLSTNGVHLDIVISRDNMSRDLLKGLEEDASFYSFGWGDENFYINTPTWDDLTFSNAFGAMFLKSSTLMHVSRYKNKRSSWVKVDLSKVELNKLNQYILGSFNLNKIGNNKISVANGYSNNDNFYRAKGSYSCLKTCNSWANKAFKFSGLKACYWTPFDFGLLRKYE